MSATELRAVDPVAGEPFGPAFADATQAEIAAATSAAAAAFAAEQSQRSFSDAALLRAIADGIELQTPALRERAMRETGLPEARLTGELARTVGQLRAFAGVVDSGEELDAIVDTAVADAAPPRPDQRRVNVALGPVAVFAASNFPFAFSVAGGDTAAALAAGCPVLLKAHPAHPGTSAATAAIVSAALAEVGAPPAWFALVHGAPPEVGQLVANAEPIEAIAFTGSLRAGVALNRAAALRERPIPFFGELGSINPLLVTPAAAAARGTAVAAGLATAITGSVGQLCTKPGLIVLVDDAAGRALVSELEQALGLVAPATMLYTGLRDGFAHALAEVSADPRVRVRVAAPPQERAGAWQAAALVETDAATLQPGDRLLEELFGPSALVVWCADEAELIALVRAGLPGSLTATLHAQEGEPLAATLVPLLGARAGRLILDGYPTGVIVGRATVHGGPFPATTAAAHTSVGMTAVRRFLRPLGYQGFPDALLPAALQDANPLGIVRRVNGALTAAAVERT